MIASAKITGSFMFREPQLLIGVWFQWNLFSPLPKLTLEITGISVSISGLWTLLGVRKAIRIIGRPWKCSYSLKEIKRCSFSPVAPQDELFSSCIRSIQRTLRDRAKLELLCSLFQRELLPWQNHGVLYGFWSEKIFSLHNVNCTHS